MNSHEQAAGGAEVRGNCCPLYHEAVELVGRRWTGAILRVLMDGPLRFSELRDSSGLGAQVQDGARARARAVGDPALGAALARRPSGLGSRLRLAPPVGSRLASKSSPRPLGFGAA